MILFDSISKNYGKNIVLNNVNLMIEGGELVSIIGPSGAGKTTLVKILIGDLQPDYGNITVDGYEITSLKKAALQYFRRKIGVIFQDYKLLANKTVYENVAYAMEVCGANSADIKMRTMQMLDLVGIVDQKNSFPKHLSGGESQRVAIARALVNNPKLLIADEPTGNLDPFNTKAIIKLLQKINQMGTTVILASHDSEMINLINKRVVALHDGSVVSDNNESGYFQNLKKAEEIMEIHLD